MFLTEFIATAATMFRSENIFEDMHFNTLKSKPCVHSRSKLGPAEAILCWLAWYKCSHLRLPWDSKYHKDLTDSQTLGHGASLLLCIELASICLGDDLEELIYRTHRETFYGVPVRIQKRSIENFVLQQFFHNTNSLIFLAYRYPCIYNSQTPKPGRIDKTEPQTKVT